MIRRTGNSATQTQVTFHLQSKTTMPEHSNFYSPSPDQGQRMVEWHKQEIGGKPDLLTNTHNPMSRWAFDWLTKHLLHSTLKSSLVPLSLPKVLVNILGNDIVKFWYSLPLVQNTCDFPLTSHFIT